MRNTSSTRRFVWRQLNDLVAIPSSPLVDAAAAISSVTIGLIGVTLGSHGALEQICMARDSLVETPAAKVDLGLLIALYAFQSGLVLLCLCLLRLSSRLPLALVQTRTGMLAIVAFLVSSAALYWVLRRWRATRDEHRRQFKLTAAMSFVSLVIIGLFGGALVGEASIRIAAEPVFEGTPSFRGRLLLPRDWSEVAERYRWRMAHIDESIFMYDRDVGWSLRSGLADPETLYTTSVEGVRSASPTTEYAARSPERRIALVGDSFTFAEDVAFNESWGFLLEQELGSNTQVLNFGVPAYGIDQAYLKYKYTARSWDPDIVILGLIAEDLVRAQVVFPFIRRPYWANPFSKPRLIRVDEGIEVLNHPTLKPGEVFAHERIEDLPYLEYDIGYHASHWEQSAMDFSFLARLAMSRLRPGDTTSAMNGRSAKLELASRIYQAFVDSVLRAGSQPLIVYLPNRQDIADHEQSRPDPRPERESLVATNLPVLDLTSCVAQVQGDSFMFGGSGHYTPIANRAVATCIAVHLNT